MRALLDTNIIIHRETDKIVNQSIGTLFRWLDKAKYEKCVHPITVREFQKLGNPDKLDTFNVKLQSYVLLKTEAPWSKEIQSISDEFDKGQNDANDTKLLNEVFQDRVDILISEDKKIHLKAAKLGLQDRVFRIDGLLEKVVAENPDLIDYQVLSVSKQHFGNINLQDNFFDSFRGDYQGFDKWFNRKSDEIAYVTHNNGRILSFLYIKVEGPDENYSDIAPAFQPKKRLKIGTFKVVSNGVKLGERFLKIVFDNALSNKVDEIYVTIFDRTEEQKRLIELLSSWGFVQHGTKITPTGNELVFVRDFTKHFEPDDPKSTYPRVSLKSSVYLCPIYPEYHTELFPDSILKTESSLEFKESHPHRNALSKVYISRSINRNLKSGDIIVFYRTGGYYKSVVTTIGIVERVIDAIPSEAEFILKCRQRSVFSDAQLKDHWRYSETKPFIVNFLYSYSFPKRINMERLIELGVIRDKKSAPRGFEQISKEQFLRIIRESKTDESIIVD